MDDLSMYEMVDAPMGYSNGIYRFKVPSIDDMEQMSLPGVDINGKDYTERLFQLIYPEAPKPKEPEPRQTTESKSQDTPIKNAKTFSNKKEFVQTLNAAYRQELQRRGMDPNYAGILVAQDALETAYGKSVKGDYNFGNITTNGSDWHVKTNNHKWKDFKSLQEYVSYKIDFLSNKRYRYFQTFSANSNPAVAMQVLANRGYCPNSPTYGSKIASVLNSISKYI